GAPPCLTCHGANGEGNAAAGFPRLAGLSAAYQSKQLHDFASGERGNPIMAPIANALSDQQIEALARYYAGLETVSGTVDAPQARLEAGGTGGQWPVERQPARLHRLPWSRRPGRRHRISRPRRPTR